MPLIYSIVSGSTLVVALPPIPNSLNPLNPVLDNTALVFEPVVVTCVPESVHGEAVLALFTKTNVLKSVTDDIKFAVKVPV